MTVSHQDPLLKYYDLTSLSGVKISEQSGTTEDTIKKGGNHFANLSPLFSHAPFIV